jgi:flavin-dependent dehydrogenase
VLIAGGGLAGLCLAVQLGQELPGARILVAEKGPHPRPEAAHKVGESSVEVASHYFREVLGLSDLLAQELPKFGLRFFMSHSDNTDISIRLECGPGHFLYVPSYQIDRGRFENALTERALATGSEFLSCCEVTGATLAREGGEHTVCLERNGGCFEVRSRWLVDAGGRASLVKKRLDLARSSRHAANAAWFRMDHPIDIDEWSDDPGWRSRLEAPRRASTNHLMGEGYWVWLIPLAGGRTSVGIVADARLHPFTEISSFERALRWLERHEPQCADIVRSHTHERMDFHALRNYSHDVKQVYSSDRWCLTGDAGIFLDPLYSPGSDFIGIANGFACDLIARDLNGQAIAEIAASYDQAFRSLARTYLVTYHRQYPLMGHPRVMATKVVWDFVMYWGGVALLFCRNKLCDAAFMDRARPILQRFAQLNVWMQAFFRRWAEISSDNDLRPGSFVDYAQLSFLAELNHNLQIERDDLQLLEQLTRNLELARELKQEILAEARAAGVFGERLVTPTTEHLGHVFAAMAPGPLHRV